MCDLSLEHCFNAGISVKKKHICMYTLEWHVQQCLYHPIAHVVESRSTTTNTEEAY